MKASPIVLAALLLSGAAPESEPLIDRAAFEANYCNGHSYAHRGELVKFEEPTEALETTVSVDVRSDKVLVGGLTVVGTEGLRDVLLEKRDEAVALGERPGLEVRFEGRLTWFVAPDVRADQLAELLAVSTEAGFVESYWVVEVAGAPPPPPFADPQLARKVQMALDAANGLEEELQVLRDGTNRAARGCYAAQELFEAASYAPLEMKCLFLAAGIEEIVARCPRKAPQILTMLQIPLTPDRELGAIRTRWASDAEALVVAADLPWQELASVLAKQAGAPIRMEVQTATELKAPLLGTWDFVTVDGDARPEAADISWRFEPDLFVEVEGDKELSSAYQLDLTTDPPRIEFVSPAARAIFFLEVDRLLIKLNDRTPDWPVDFDVSSTQTLVELKRRAEPS